jgi:pimeloyl-ACP methyl ester carboxylesterase
MQEFTSLDGPGHWLQDEQPEEVCSGLLSFLRNNTECTLSKERYRR